MAAHMPGRRNIYDAVKVYINYLLNPSIYENHAYNIMTPQNKIILQR